MEMAERRIVSHAPHSMSPKYGAIWLKFRGFMGRWLLSVGARRTQAAEPSISLDRDIARLRHLLRGRQQEKRPSWPMRSRPAQDRDQQIRHGHQFRTPADRASERRSHSRCNLSIYSWTTL